MEWFIILQLIDPLLDFVATSQTLENQVTIKIRANGFGSHKFTIRTSNLSVSTPEKSIVLTADSSQTISFQASIVNANSPCYAVIVPDDDILQRKEVRIESATSTSVNAVNTNNDIRVYPSPSTGLFTIATTGLFEINEPINIEIKNLAGQGIYANNTTVGAKESIDIQLNGRMKIANGIYVITLKSKTNTASKKIIIQK
jgi:hypothetical protein